MLFSKIIWLQAFSTETLDAKFIPVSCTFKFIIFCSCIETIFDAAILLLSKRASTRDAESDALRGKDPNERCNFQNQQSEFVR